MLYFLLFQMLIESNKKTRFLRKSQIDFIIFLDFLYDNH